jgi:hypothetical protein
MEKEFQRVMLMSWVKRFVPFFLTFILGLFVASFFVSVGFPKINKFERRGYHRHSEYNCPLRYERNNLRFELENLRRENERLRGEKRLNFDIDIEEVPLPPIPPPPPSRIR